MPAQYASTHAAKVKDFKKLTCGTSGVDLMKTFRPKFTDNLVTFIAAVLKLKDLKMA
jgi:hypothetical protein